MKGDPRIHHYLPQGYLRGFARSPTKNAQLHVYDVKDDRWFPTTCRNVGAERDFNRVDTEGFEPGALEKRLAQFEGQVATVLRRMRDARSIPTGRDFDVLMNLLAAVAIRNPQMRRQIHHAQAQTAKLIMSTALATKDRWEAAKRQMRAAGEHVNNDITYEQMKEFHERGEYTITVAQSRYFRLEMVGMEAILPYLAMRKWTLFVADGVDNRHFVTCDRPAMLMWIDENRAPVGHGLKGTALLFPISKELAMFGLFESDAQTRALGSTVACDNAAVAKINSFALAYAERQVYSPSPRFKRLAMDAPP